VQNFRETVFGVLNQLKLVHIVIFLLSLGGCLFFLLALVRPFLRRTSKETRQIAEMLSQLPNDMDLEALVGQALAAGGCRAGMGWWVTLKVTLHTRKQLAIGQQWTLFWGPWELCMAAFTSVTGSVSSPHQPGPLSSAFQHLQGGG
jgi:hypothetical protein